MKVKKFYTIALWCSLLFCSCKSYKDQQKELPDTPTSGEITISADISFKPIVDELVKVYESNNFGTTINVQYKPESECVKDLWNDSIRMVISTISLSAPEKVAISDSLKVSIDQLPVARDAIAVIVHPNATDSLFNMSDIKAILSGTYSKPFFPVFDGVKTTSTVRHMVDSVLKGAPLTNKAVAANTSDSVIEYVAVHPNAVGFIGVSWIGNPEDEQQLSFLKKVKIAHLKSSDKEGKYILPVQANLYGKRYPITRDLTYILKEKYRGLGTGFAAFLRGEIGQLIFKRAYLMPGRRYFIVRPIQLKEDAI
ncbi:PstS family phosphate ABC transporter substrate-binding protein [Niabella insulamsoli]|uniref:PstS family phosphate ABC transporter substrate-binding protein n=1 Tax=Niabella insulamsoli TaxID=3144874 RepID=UPI0031FD46B6